MNPENYGSREACQRLVDAGIVLGTEVYWHISENSEPELLSVFFLGSLQCFEGCKVIPAPSIAEVWRELPNNVLPEALNGLIRCRFDKTKEEDYLISLLIWVRQEGEEG